MSAAPAVRHSNSRCMIKYLNISRSVQNMFFLKLQSIRFFRIVTDVTIPNANMWYRIGYTVIFIHSARVPGECRSTCAAEGTCTEFANQKCSKHVKVSHLNKCFTCKTFRLTGNIFCSSNLLMIPRTH